jgi:hypothetical protein
MSAGNTSEAESSPLGGKPPGAARNHCDTRTYRLAVEPICRIESCSSATSKATNAAAPHFCGADASLDRLGSLRLTLTSRGLV